MSNLRDQIYIQNRLKRKKIESEQKKEKNKKENKEEKNKKLSAFAKKREVESALMAREQLLVVKYMDVYFTNNLNSLPCEITSLL